MKGEINHGWRLSFPPPISRLCFLVPVLPTINHSTFYLLFSDDCGLWTDDFFPLFCFLFQLFPISRLRFPIFVVFIPFPPSTVPPFTFFYLSYNKRLCVLIIIKLIFGAFNHINIGMEQKIFC